MRYMIKPFKGDYPLTQEFGGNADYYKQFNIKGHNGLDFGVPTGTVIVAPHAGIVIEVGFDANGYGNYLKIESETESSTLGHLQDIKVSVGFKLNEGDEVGTSDNTGYSTGPHLHWGYVKKPRNRDNGYNGYIDQTPFLTTSSAPVSGKLYTEEQYLAAMNDRNKFWNERDEQIRKNEELNKLVTEANARLTAFEAAGYTTVDDINKTLAPYNELKALSFATVDDVSKVLKGKDEELNGVKAALVQALDRNKVIMGELQKKENDDATAIQTGIEALKELAELKDSMVKIHKTVGLDPKKGLADLWQLLSKIDFFKKWAKKAIEQKQAERNAELVQPSPAPSVLNTVIESKENKSADWWLKAIGLVSGLVIGLYTPYLLHLV